MPTVDENVAVAVTGAVYKGEAGASAPTGTSGALTGYDEMGWISEEGIVRTMPGAGEATVLKGWQNGATVRIIRAAGEENPTFQLTLLETKIETIEAAYEATVTQSATEGEYVVDAHKVRGKFPWVLHVIDGAELERIYIPQGEIIELGEQTLANTSAVGHQITIEAHRDSTIGGHFKTWSTRLKTA